MPAATPGALRSGVLFSGWMRLVGDAALLGAAALARTRPMGACRVERLLALPTRDRALPTRFCFGETTAAPTPLLTSSASSLSTC